MNPRKAAIFDGGPEMTPEKLASLFHEYYEEEAD